MYRLLCVFNWLSSCIDFCIINSFFCKVSNQEENQTFSMYMIHHSIYSLVKIKTEWTICKINVLSASTQYRGKNKKRFWLTMLNINCIKLSTANKSWSLAYWKTLCIVLINKFPFSTLYPHWGTCWVPYLLHSIQRNSTCSDKKQYRLDLVYNASLLTTNMYWLPSRWVLQFISVLNKSRVSPYAHAQIISFSSLNFIFFRKNAYKLHFLF